VRDYLILQRFRSVERWGEYLEVFEGPRGSRHTVVAPVNRKIADYPNRLAVLLNDLAQLYGESIDNIISAIVNSGYEPLKIIANEGENDNTLGYDATLDLLRSAFRLIDYSAVVELADHPLRIVQGRRKDIIRDYLNTVRVGQTEVGSYVLTLLMPRRASGLSTEWSESDTDAFGAKIAKRLNRSLSVAKSAISNAGPDAEALVEQGLTANFMNTLATMVDAVPCVALGVQAERPERGAAADLQRFRSSDRVSLLQVGSILTPPEMRSPISLRGTITRITEPSKRASGQIVVETEIYGETKPVRVAYTRADRDTVMQAIERKSEVSIEVDGTLVQRRGQYVLEHPANFRLSGRGLLT
jgi:hypothetical protein